MKALLDILNEEKSIICTINRIDSDVRSRNEYLEHIRRLHPDCEAKERDIKEIIVEIDMLKTERSKKCEVLRDVQRELAYHVIHLNDDI